MATTKSAVDAALARAKSHRQQDLDDLIEELRIPSISTLPERREDCLRCANWLRERLQKMGFDARIVDFKGGRHPLVIADSKSIPGRRHVTVYGHYDVQPPDPLDEWRSPPFEPEIRDGHLWARGASDNKGNHMTAVKAVEHLVESGGLPVNVRFLFEGEEEISGHSLPAYLREHGSELKTDAVLVWDSGMDEEGNPTLATSLRGLVYTELRAHGAGVDLHSGTFGGVAPNPINTLAHVISALKDRHGHINIPGFYDDVRKPSDEEHALWKKKESHYVETAKKIAGIRELEGESEFGAIERGGARPTLDVNGITGGFIGDGQKTVIPARASAKISMRLVPDQDPKRIFDAFEKRVRDLTTPGVEIEVRELSSAPPVSCSVDNSPARALRAAYKEAFGKDTALIRVGGSIPVAVDFQNAVGAPLLVSGIPQADSALHSPNEHLLIDNYHRGIEALIRFLCAIAV